MSKATCIYRAQFSVQTTANSMFKVLIQEPAV